VVVNHGFMYANTKVKYAYGGVIGGAGPPSRYRWKSFTGSDKPIFIVPQM
jgi:hypothetical protein